MEYFSSVDLLSDLELLRKNEGATASRMAIAGAVSMALGDPDEDAQIKIERLISAIQSLDRNQAEVLMFAFGLSPETAGAKNLKARREIYGARVQRGIDTVTAREKPALEQLRIQLLTGWYPASPIPGRVPELHNSVINEYVSVTTIVADGRWMESRHQYRMLALFDKADYYAISTSYPMQTTSYNGWRSEQWQTEGGFQLRFFPPEPMRRGNFYDLQFKLEAPPGDPDDLSAAQVILEESLAFHERTLQSKFEVVFVGRKPELVFRYHGLTSTERPGRPNSDNIIDFEERTSVVARFHDLYGGLFAGLAWKW